jgi:hypothetical protein
MLVILRFFSFGELLLGIDIVLVDKHLVELLPSVLCDRFALPLSLGVPVSWQACRTSRPPE